LIAVVIVGALPQVLIDGIITHHQVVPSGKPGESSLVISGDDISVRLDLEEKSATYPNQPDSVIVTRIIADYATYGLVPTVTPTTDVPIEVDRVPTQQGTDLQFVQELARRNGFVFYIEPTAVPGLNTAYWGLDNRLGLPQPALTMNMGADSNVDVPIHFQFDALAPVAPQVAILEPLTKQKIPIPIPSSLQPPLASRPPQALRKTLPRNTANLDPAQAALRALSAASRSADVVAASGQVDAVRYGRVLQARRLVGVRGVGSSYDGTYYVKEVRHHIEPGKYMQNFSLTRDGRGALLPLVVP
jgi:phage protein D